MGGGGGEDLQVTEAARARMEATMVVERILAGPKQARKQDRMVMEVIWRNEDMEL